MAYRCMFLCWEHWQLIAHYNLLWTNFPAMPSLYHSSGLIALCLYHAVFQLFPGHWFSGTISTHMKTNRWLEWAQIKWVIHYGASSPFFWYIKQFPSDYNELKFGGKTHNGTTQARFNFVYRISTVSDLRLIDQYPHIYRQTPENDGS